MQLQLVHVHTTMLMTPSSTVTTLSLAPAKALARSIRGLAINTKAATNQFGALLLQNRLVLRCCFRNMLQEDAYQIDLNVVPM